MKRAAAFFSALAVALMPLLSACGKTKDKDPFAGAPFTVDFLSTGKSDCFLIRADGYVILQDTADEDDYAVIRALLRAYGITRIDRLILSHYDNDHIGSAYKILTDYEVGEVIAPNFTLETRLYIKLMDAIEGAGVKLVLLKEDLRFDRGSLRMWINAPEKDAYEDKNNYSLITSVYYGEVSFLFTGDALKERMVEFGRVCTEAYTLVKLPHHGSYNKGLRVFLTEYPPEYAVYTSENIGYIDERLASLLDQSKCTLFATAQKPVKAAVKDGVLIIDYN